MSNPYVKNRDFVELLKSMESSVGPIPRHVKNIFHLCGFTTTSIISSIGEKELRECQEYIIQVDRELAPAVEEIYSTYYACPEKFRFTPGDIIIINKMVQLCKSEPQIPREEAKCEENSIAVRSLKAAVVSWMQLHISYENRVDVQKNFNVSIETSFLIYISQYEDLFV